jgi:predicted transglutaminase-like cysteine proteinase
VRSVVHAAILAAAAGLAGAPALAITPGLFGTTEFEAESLRDLPQWQSVLARMAAEAAVTARCRAASEQCPTRATRAWSRLLRSLDGASPLTQLREVNRFVNGWRYRADSDNYGRSDYWATPLEFFRRAGDCEDYVIAKYRSLRLLGMPADRLRMVVLQDAARDLPHAVLAVYLGDRILILDNLSDEVLPQERLPHYLPYYSVNETARWAHLAPDSPRMAGAVPAGSPTASR